MKVTSELMGALVPYLDSSTSLDEVRARLEQVGCEERDLNDGAARIIYDAIHGDGTWDNPGTLPDEIDRQLWRRAALAVGAFMASKIAE